VPQAQPDDSFAAFMTERRASKERMRLQQVAVKRREQRWQHRHGHSPPPPPSAAAREADFVAFAAEKRAAAEAAGKRCAPDASLRSLFEMAQSKEKQCARWRRATKKRREAREAARHGSEAPRRGRPPDPQAEQRRQAEREQREQQRLEKAALLRQRKEQAAARCALQAAAQRASPVLQTWSTEGQCQGTTRCGDRCKVHRSSVYSVAAPLRHGARFCGHHAPEKFTGVRCAGIKKHGKGQCRVWSGSCYADAAPLRRGSPYCHHHRVRCAGLTHVGSRCTITTSSEHAHAEPLRRGEPFCLHHCGQHVVMAQPLPPNADSLPMVAAQLIESHAATNSPTCDRLAVSYVRAASQDGPRDELVSDSCSDIIDELPRGVYVDSDGNVYSDDDCGY